MNERAPFSLCLLYNEQESTTTQPLFICLSLRLHAPSILEQNLLNSWNGITKADEK